MAKIEDKLHNINETLEKMLAVMNKPESLFDRVLTIGGMIASILGIVVVIDIIAKWFKEGL
ncbi:MAG: hypothetical protein FWB95_08425 [Treponema sp.]|nr:hypothetical protein [Treponema sp.]